MFGCLTNMAPLILICTSILLPVVIKLGADPVHFDDYAVMFAVLLIVTFVPALSLWLPALVIR